MMRLTRNRTYRDAAREHSEGFWPGTREGLIARLRAFALAVQARAYLWFGYDKGLIGLHEANALLAEIRKPHWACWWIPESWLREKRPSLLTDAGVRLFVLPERLRHLPSFPEEWFDED